MIPQRQFKRPRIVRRWADEYGTGAGKTDAKRRRKTNSRRGFLSQVAEGYRGN